MRVVAEERSQQLEAALAAANREIAERERAEQEREQLRDQFLAAQKMEAIGTLAGGVAHDINNVLAGILSLAELCRDEAPPGIREDLEQIVASCQRGAALTRNLLAFSRRRPASQGPLRIDQVAHGVTALLHRTLPKRVELVTHLADDAVVLGDGDQLTQAVVNLCTNAVDAIDDRGRISLFTRRAELTADAADALHLPPGRYAVIAVADTGAGMDEATLARAVEPFFSTKGIGQGTGLGLSMVHGLAAQLGGSMRISSRVGAGTSVDLWLPLSSDSPAAVQPDEEIGPHADGRSGTVLLVDDEPLIRMSTADMLGEMGYSVTEAASGEEALEIVEAGLEPAILITDQLMPGITGTELVLRVRQLSPATIVLIISGYAEVEGIAPNLPRLTKPFRETDLAAMLGDLTGA